MMRFEQSDNVAAALGKAVIAFSELDMILGYGLAFLMLKSSGADDVGRILKENMTYSGRVTALGMTFSLRVQDRDLKSRMKELQEDLRRANERRNSLVHDEWFWSEREKRIPEQAGLAGVSKRGDMYPKDWVKPVSVDDLYAATTTWGNLCHAIVSLLNDAETSWRK